MIDGINTREQEALSRTNALFGEITPKWRSWDLQRPAREWVRERNKLITYAVPVGYVSLGKEWPPSLDSVKRDESYTFSLHQFDVTNIEGIVAPGRSRISKRHPAVFPIPSAYVQPDASILRISHYNEWNFSGSGNRLRDTNNGGEWERRYAPDNVNNMGSIAYKFGSDPVIERAYHRFVSEDELVTIEELEQWLTTIEQAKL